MKLRDIEFSPVFTASGVQGFFGEGYWYSHLPPWSLASFKGTTFVSKTTTFKARVGNMPRKSDGITPLHRIPACIKVNFLRGFVLNAVGLSGPGVLELLRTQHWQQRREPFLIPFMAVSASMHDRENELKAFCGVMKAHRSQFRAPFGIELNISCPNVGVRHTDLANEVWRMLDIAAWFEVPLVVNFNLNAPVELVSRIAEHPDCDAVSVANSLPWGSASHLVDWESLFHSKTSPLAHLGGGGLSGAPLLQVLMRWIGEARCRITKPLIVGGGILSPDDALLVVHCGAPTVRGVKLGVIRMLRPWRFNQTVRVLRTALMPPS